MPPPERWLALLRPLNLSRICCTRLPPITGYVPPPPQLEGAVSGVTPQARVGDHEYLDQVACGADISPTLRTKMNSQALTNKETKVCQQ